MKTQKLFVVVIVLLLASCRKEEFTNNPTDASQSSLHEMIAENGNNPDEAILSATARTSEEDEGYVYIQSNDADKNTIINFAQSHEDGSLTLEETVMTGGKGAGKALGSEGAVALNKNHTWLLAVNAGSNSISSFSVDEEGDLELKDTKSSEGKFPVSVCIYGDLVYVVNSDSWDIAGFTLQSDGRLHYITGSHQKLSAPGAAPAQIAFSPDGHSVVVTEKLTNTISTFKLSSAGAAGAGIFTPSVGKEPFGFDFSRNMYMVVSNAAAGTPNKSSCTSYGGLPHPSAINGAIPNFQTAACWVSASKYGRFAYVANTGSNTIVTYYVASSGDIFFLPWTIMQTGKAPSDLRVSGDNKYVYCINSESHTIGKFKRTFFGILINIGHVSNIPAHAAGMAAY